MPGIGKQAGWLLRVFGAHVDQAFGHVPYHVGSSLRAATGARWRDVDVRLILPDEEYVAYFGDLDGRNGHANKCAMWELAWSTLGRKMTGLPIDFQIQSQTLANEQFDGPRSALVLLSTEIPVVMDRVQEQG